MTELDNIRYFAVSDIGMRRKRNEDAYAIYDAADTMAVGNGMGLLFAVADGLGGHACGDLASQMACREMKAFFDGSYLAGVKGKVVEKFSELIHLIDLRIMERRQRTLPVKTWRQPCRLFSLPGIGPLRPMWATAGYTACEKTNWNNSRATTRLYRK